MSILHQEGSFFYCPFFTDLFIMVCKVFYHLYIFW